MPTMVSVVSCLMDLMAIHRNGGVSGGMSLDCNALSKAASQVLVLSAIIRIELVKKLNGTRRLP